MNLKTTYPEKIFLLGAGGIGMSALGHYFLQRGVKVAGYDRTPSETTAMLQKSGAMVMFRDDIRLIPDEFTSDTAMVIYTPAVPSELQLINFFRNNGYTLYKRAQVLGMIAKGYSCFAIAGTHGKTTTTSAVTHILRQCGNNCTAFIGGISKNLQSNFAGGSSNIMVAEADEYDRSFHQLFPRYSVVTSVEPDHLDIYGDYNAVKESFRKFASQTQENGCLLVNEKYAGILSGTHPHMFTYGGVQSDYYAENIRTSEQGIAYDFVFRGKKVYHVTVPVYGLHNAENTVAAGAIAHLSGMKEEDICQALSTFTGVKRRFDVIFSAAGKMLVDDYAHHPDEINALARTLRSHFPGKKTAALFQPHLFTRTRDFADGFASALSLFDIVMLLDIYPARELPIEGITSQMLLGKINAKEKYLVNKEDANKIVSGNEFDILVTIGAGDIDTMIPALKNQMQMKYES